METIDVIFVAVFQPPKEHEPKFMFRGEKHPITRWTSVYGSQEEAYRGAATFIRDLLLWSNLRSTANRKAIREIEAAIRRGDVENVISLWNDEVPQFKVKIYKGTET